jgi:hypothetical protein
MATRFARPIDHPELDGMPVRRKITGRMLPAHMTIDAEVVKVSGELYVNQYAELADLKLDQDVTVSIANADGQVIAHGPGRLMGGGQKIKELDGVRWVVQTWTAAV